MSVSFDGSATRWGFWSWPTCSWIVASPTSTCPRRRRSSEKLTLTLGVAAILIGTQWLRRALAGDKLLGLLIAYMGWGLLRTVPNMHIFGVQVTVRDAAALVLRRIRHRADHRRHRCPRSDWPDGTDLGRVLPWLSIWLPIALLLERSGIQGPRFRYSNVPLLSHKPGNICCAAVICLAFLLLVTESGAPLSRSPRVSRWLRPALIAINVFTMLLGATQTRGGALAEVVATALIFVLMERTRRSRVGMSLLVGLFVVLGIGLATGASYHTQKRTISVSQLFENAQSVSGGGANPQLSGSVSFRFDLWATILHEQSTTSHLINGFGFGPNLARTGGLNPRPNQPATLQLRSAHNSWLDIFARTGIIGTLLFVMVWFGWVRRLGRARRRSPDDEDTNGVIGVCLAGVVAILINCFFDPTIEGAQVAAVLFTLFGLGIMCVRAPLAPTGGAPSVPTLDRPARPSRRTPQFKK